MTVYTTEMKPSGRDIYHEDRGCSQLSDAGQVHAVDVEEVEGTHRPCDYCRYALVPTLD